MFRHFVFVRNICHIAENMVKVLNVAEKNDAAKSISEVLTRGRYDKRKGFSKYNMIYEFDYQILNQNCHMVMTSVSGHLLGLDFVGQYRKWGSCSPVTLFDAAVEKNCPENFIDIKRTLEREVRGAQFLIIWTDCDREGENIGFEVIQVCKAVKQNLQVYRAKFSEITPQAIQRACQNLIQPDKRVSDAVDVRMEYDLRTGAAFTRFQTVRLQKIFPNALNEKLISYGSCQFPTLGFVVERYKQVQAFIPEPFWKLKVLHKVDDTPVEFSWKRNRLFDHLACLVLYDHCIENPSARITDVRSRSKSKWRPTALDTVELEKLASRKLRINAKETMKIAEKLYTQGYISYPRTETNQFPKDLDLRRLVEDQTRDPNWGDFARRVSERGPTPRNGNKSDQAHPPIHPIKYTDSLQGNEKKIYEFIVRHFLACCSQDAQGFETTVEINIADEIFSTHGLMITAKNYLEVYIYEKWNAKEIPVFQKEDEFTPNSIEMAAGETSPPSLLTEADLIALMDKHGIGTDATHAEHIETIKSRMYVGVRPDGKIVPGLLGMGLVEGYDAMGYEMSKPNLRAELEADLVKVCEGTKQKQEVLDKHIKRYKEVFIEACRQATKIDEALAQYLEEEAQTLPEHDAAGSSEMLSAAVAVMKCPKCGQDMLLKSRKENKGYYVGCVGYPSCKCAVWLPPSVEQASVIEDLTCPDCGPTVHKIKFKFKPGSVPPMIPDEYDGCVGGCEKELNEMLGMQLRTSSSAAQNSNTGAPALGSRSFITQAAPRVTQGAQNNRNAKNLSNGFMGNQTSNRNYSTSNQNGTGNVYQGGDNSRPPLAVVTGNVKNSGIPQSGSGDGGNDIVCNCNNSAVLLTVRKEGPNTGRQFYKCSGSSCSFFLWSDEADSNSLNKIQSNNGYQNNQNRNSNLGSSSNFRNQNSTMGNSVSCKCGQPAKSLTVQKEGPNKGRPFYGCPAPRGQGCNFFQWADEDPGSGFDFGGGGRGQVGGGGKKRSAPSNGDRPTVKRGRKCGLCGVEGHTKKTCPHK